MAADRAGLAPVQLAAARVPRQALLPEGGPGLRRHAQHGQPDLRPGDPDARFGCGLDGLLRDRRADLRGIVNGIDTDVWSPAREPMLAGRYDATTVAPGKAACKAWLQRQAGPAGASRRARCSPRSAGSIPRRAGTCWPRWPIDLLRRRRSAGRPGEGQPKYHDLLDGLAGRHPGKLRAFLGFSDDLAHQIEAGADLFLMPSLFEPCGLNQLYSLAHGTVPIVRATGGLADTVVDATPETLADGTATGFVFVEPTARGALARDRPGPGALARPRRLGPADADRDEGRLVLGPQRPGVRRSSTRRSAAASAPMPASGREPARWDRRRIGAYRPGSRLPSTGERGSSES